MESLGGQRQQRGRSGSRASSAGGGSSSLEVRCACQYYRSESLLPERSAALLAARGAVVARRPEQQQQHQQRQQQRSGTMRTPPAGRRRSSLQPLRRGDHEYEPIGTPAIRMAMSQHSVAMRLVAPVVKITDTDVVPVADSDDSIDDRCRFQGRALVLEGDVVLPLDGRIEDNAMEGRNLGDQTLDNSVDELETPQELQDRLEARYFLGPPTVSGAEPRTEGEVGAGQTNSSIKEEVSLQQSARGLQERLKTQAGKIRSRFKNIQKPTFSIPHPRAKSAQKTKSPTRVASSIKPPASPRTDQKASRIERFRMALPERPRFSLPDKSKFHFPERPKFNLPERPKFNLPERPKFSLPDKSKFHIKKPNIQLPKSFSRPKRTASQRSAQSREPRQASNAEPATASKRAIFNFSTYPRPKLFDRKSKAKKEYATSSPKESRAQSTESSTFPRVKKASQSLTARWAQRFGETMSGFHDDSSATPPVDRAKPWRHPSLEEPRLSLKPQTSEEEEEKLPWENTERRIYDGEDETAPGDNEEDRRSSYRDGSAIKEPDLTYGKEPIKDPRRYDEQFMNRINGEEPKKKVRLVDEDLGSNIDPEIEDDTTYHPQGLYDGSFPPVDPRKFNRNQPNSVELSDDEEGSSMRSDREVQQSSGSSIERRRRGVIEEIDSDEFFLRERGISQENMRFHLISEIRDALRPKNALEDEAPPQRPKRTLSQRKRRDASVESYDTTPPPEKPKRDRNTFRRSQDSFTTQPSLDRASSLSRHRIVYQTETPIDYSKDELFTEPLDDIVIVKPVRRKSKSSLRSQSQSRLPVEEQNILLTPIHSETQSVTPVQNNNVPPIPSRRKRFRSQLSSSLSLRTVDSTLCNGYGDSNTPKHSHERIPVTPPPTPPPLFHNELIHGIHNIDELNYIEPEIASVPVPPKRTRSHSRTASLAPEDDRTSHGAESLPGDFGYCDEDLPPIPRDSSSREPSLPGYAVIEKREKPPRPPPPRRKRQDKFATAPRPSKRGPQRLTRPYSTLRPAKFDTIRKSTDSMQFIDADYLLENDDRDFHRDLQSGEVLSRVQGRPLPAPPRPPRHRKSFRRSTLREITPDFSETVASTQTDPLPDDLVIEEEITMAKLVMSPSRSGSAQVLISTERIPSPSSGSLKSATSTTPPIPPLPGSAQQRDVDRSRAVEVSCENEHKVPPFDESRRIDPSQLDILRSVLFSTDEPLKIPSLEVGDLKVERLTVSQLEAYKVAASEIDAIVVSATEMSNKSESEGGIHPSLLQELIAIRNQLEAVTASQSQSRPQSAMEDAYTATSNERIDISMQDLAKESEKSILEANRSFTRESSPLLIVQPPVAEQEATVEMGRTIFPQSSSIGDLTSNSDSITISESTIIITENIEESLTTTVIEEITKDPIATTKDPAATTASEMSKGDIEAQPSEPLITRPRSRSPSPSHSHPGAVRQTASPVKSLPPVISVTPDSIITSATQDNNMPLRHVTSSGVQPQRAVISYSEVSHEDTSPSQAPPSRETFQSPPPPPSSPARQSSRSPPPSNPDHQPPSSPHQAPKARDQFVTISTSRIPPDFFSLANPPLSSSATDHRQRRDVEVEPSIADMSVQLLRALRQAGVRSFRQFVDSVVSRFGGENDGEIEESKLQRVELAMCALLLLIAILIVVSICTPKTITHHHHWDYFNPPQ